MEQSHSENATHAAVEMDIVSELRCCRAEVFSLHAGDLFILRYDPRILLPEQAQAILAALELPENIHARCLPMGALEIDVYRQDATNGTPKPNS